MDMITLLSVINYEQSRIEIFANICIMLSGCSDDDEIIYVKLISQKLLRTHPMALQWRDFKHNDNIMIIKFQCIDYNR